MKGYIAPTWYFTLGERVVPWCVADIHAWHRGLALDAFVALTRVLVRLGAIRFL